MTTIGDSTPQSLNRNRNLVGSEGGAMRISVIIPVLNEEKSIAATLLELQRLKPDELILVDGGSSDGTREVCQRFGVEFYPSSRGRARQMNFGAQRGTGDVLLFLHADTRLPPSAFDDIRSALQDQGVVGGRFDLQLDDARPMLRLVGFMISLRSRISKVGTGDQAILCGARFSRNWAATLTSL